MPRKTTSIKIDTALWKKVKIHCVQNDKDISDFLEELIRRELEVSTSSKG